MVVKTIDHAAPVEEDSFDIYQAIRELLQTVDIEFDAPGVEQLDIIGRDPLVKSARIRYGAVAAAPAVAVAIVASQIHHLRTGVAQNIQCDLREAINNHAISWKVFPTLAGKPPNLALLKGNPFLHDVYRTKDGRFLVPTAVYPHHQSGWYTLLQIPPEKTRVADAIANWDSEELEQAAVKLGLPCSIVRTPEEWKKEEQGKVLLSSVPAPVLKLGDAPVKHFPISQSDDQPLSGIKVLMATHAIAGPSAGRVLASYGAEVLQVYRPVLGFEHEVIYNEANAGCRSCALDFNDESDFEQFKGLIKGADVFIESFSPSALPKYELTNEELLKINGNLIICHTKLFGLVGPWKDRKGHDQTASSSVGVLHYLGQHREEVSGNRSLEISEVSPAWPEPSLVNDFTTGVFGALGICAALLRRATQGGSWQIGPSLGATCTWYLHQLPLVPSSAFQIALSSGSDEYEIKSPPMIEGYTDKGFHRRVGHFVKLSKTPLAWKEPLITVAGSSAPTFDREAEKSWNYAQVTSATPL